ncbi:MAG: hypothetical protein WAN43_09040 [Rhodomicrobium sp.]
MAGAASPLSVSMHAPPFFGKFRWKLSFHPNPAQPFDDPGLSGKNGGEPAENG